MQHLQTRLLQSILVALIMEGTAVAEPPRADLKRLGESEIRRAIAGKVVRLETNIQYSETFYAEGQWILAYDGRAPRQAFGKWSVDDGEICVATPVNRRCRPVLREPGTGKIFMAPLALPPASDGIQPVALYLEDAGPSPSETLLSTPVISPPRCPTQSDKDHKAVCR
jgi:hypothetical protein